MSSFFERLSNIFKGKASLAASELETNNVEAVYESAMQEGQARLVALRDQVAGLVATRSRRERELESLQDELLKLEAGKVVALDEGDDDSFLVLEHRRSEVAAKVDGLGDEIVKLETLAEEGRSGIQAYAHELESLKREAQQMIAKKELAEAQIIAQETLSGFSADADVVGLTKVREHVDALHSKAHEGYLNEDGESVRAKVERTAQISAQDRARAELERLKALRDGRKTALAEHAEPEESPASEEPDASDPAESDDAPATGRTL